MLHHVALTIQGPEGYTAGSLGLWVRLPCAAYSILTVFGLESACEIPSIHPET